MKIYIPQHTVCIKLKDPSFVTPLIKHLLRKRNLAMRRHKLEKASAVRKKINQLIVDKRKTILSKATTSNTKQLWSMVKKSDNGGRKWHSSIDSYSAMTSTLTFPVLQLTWITVTIK